MSWRSPIIPHKLPYVPSVQRFNLTRVPLFNKRDEETCNIDKTPIRHWGIEALRSRVVVMHILAWKESASAWCRRQHEAVVEASCQKRQMHFDILPVNFDVSTYSPAFCVLCLYSRRQLHTTSLFPSCKSCWIAIYCISHLFLYSPPWPQLIFMLNTVLFAGHRPHFDILYSPWKSSEKLTEDLYHTMKWSSYFHRLSPFSTLLIRLGIQPHNILKKL